MISFEIDFNDLNENIDNFMEYRNAVASDYSYCYSTLNNVDSAWNDDTMKEFKKLLSTNNEDVEEIFKYVSNLYNEISDFKNNISSIVKKYYSTNNLYYFKYSNENLEDFKTYIENAMDYIADAVDYICEILYPADFSEYDLVEEINRFIQELKWDLSNCKVDVTNLNIEISNEISQSKYRSYFIKKPKINLKSCNYTWSNVYANLKVTERNVDETIKKIQKSSNFNIGNSSLNYSDDYGKQTNLKKSEIKTNKTIDQDLVSEKMLDENLKKTNVNNKGSSFSRSDEYGKHTNLEKSEIKTNKIIDPDLTSRDMLDEKTSGYKLNENVNTQLNSHDENVNDNVNENDRINLEEFKLNDASQAMDSINFSNTGVDNLKIDLDSSKVNVNSNEVKNIDTLNNNIGNVDFNTNGSEVNINSNTDIK